MTISWSFDSSGQFDFPVLILDNRFRYIGSGRNSSGDVKFFKCMGWQSGCEALVSIGSRYHEEGEGGWGFITLYLLDFTPLAEHTCSSMTDAKILVPQHCDLESLQEQFNQFDLTRS